MSRSKDRGRFGFKDIEVFNVALLDKQLWRLLVNKDFLLARVYKSRYNKKSDPLLYQLAWKTEMSPKMHHFLWRCISNSLPLACNMVRRHISKDAACSICGAETECVNHVVFQCLFARLVWAHSQIPTPPEGIMMNSMYSNLFHVLNIRKEYPRDDFQAELVPWILWRLWKDRNELLFKGKEYEATSIIQKTKEYEEEWRERNREVKSEVERGGATKTITTTTQHSWSPPPANRLKCNSDGAWNPSRERSGLGWICRNER